MKLRKTHLLWIPLVVCLFLVNSVNVMAAIEQVIHVKGQVVDSTGEPVIGANIVVKGTNTGVISDIDGNFAIDAPKNSVLLISFIGYKSQEVKVTGPSVKIVLTDDAEMLNEVVVVGYGSCRKHRDGIARSCCRCGRTNGRRKYASGSFSADSCAWRAFA